MEYKQKYNDLLARLKAMVDVQSDVTKQAFIDLFPEIAESENEKIRKEIIGYLKSRDYDIEPRWLIWLEKLMPIELDEEEIATAKKQAFNDALDKIEYSSDSPTFDDGWSAAIKWVRLSSFQPKQEWNEDDERMISTITDILEGESARCHSENGNVVYEKDYIDEINWLKALRPTKHWRPTAEQMRVLSRFRSVGVPDVRGNDLVLFDELFKQLCEL